LRYSLVFLVLTVFAILLACSGGRSDPLASDAEDRLDPPGIATLPNTPPGAGDLRQAFDQISKEAFGAAWKASNALVMTQDLKLDRMRVMGNYSGYAVASGGAVYMQDSLINDYNLTLSFVSYSSSGLLLLNGALTVHSRMTQQLTGGWRYGHMELDGTVSYKGDWKGQLEYIDFRLPVKPNGEMVSSMSVFQTLDTVPSSFYPKGKVVFTSEKGEFEFTPYY